MVGMQHMQCIYGIITLLPHATQRTSSRLQGYTVEMRHMQCHILRFYYVIAVFTRIQHEEKIRLHGYMVEIQHMQYYYIL